MNRFPQSFLRSLLKLVDYRIGIKKKLIYSHILILIPALLVPAYLYYNKSVDAVRQVLLNEKFELTGVINSSIENYFSEIEKITLAPRFSSEMQETLQSLKYKVGMQRKEAEEKLFNTIDVLIGMRSDIVGIFIFDDTNNKYYKTSISDITPFYSFVDQPFFREMKRLKGERLIIPTHKADYYVTKTPRYILSIGRSILSKETNEEIGVIYVDLDLAELGKIIAPLQDGHNRFYILDGDRKLVYGKDEQLLGETFDAPWLPEELAKGRTNAVRNIDGQRKLLTFTYSEGVGWWYITETDLDPLIAPSAAEIKRTIAAIFAGSLLICLIISYALSTSITSPIKALHDAMKTVRSENFQKVDGIRSKDELGALARAYNDMIDKITELINTVYKVSIKEKEAQLTALQSQINPHFLYNTLNSISCMAELKGVREIGVICKAVSDLFRYSIRAGDDLVPLSEEIESIKNYMTIQSSRYENRIEAIYQVEEHLHDVPVLKFSLQPIVENAVYHGLEPKKGKGTVVIRVQQDGDKLLVNIFDNGVGMPEEEVRRIRLALEGGRESFPGNGAGGIGISNVNDRIRLRFGPEYGIELRSKVGSGTSVRIVMPARLA